MPGMSQVIFGRGITQGITRGVTQNAIEVARRKLADGQIGIDLIAKYSGLEIEEVEKIAEGMRTVVTATGRELI